jgi:hypothetical protein
MNKTLASFSGKFALLGPQVELTMLMQFSWPVETVVMGSQIEHCRRKF